MSPICQSCSPKTIFRNFVCPGESKNVSERLCVPHLNVAIPPRRVAQAGLAPDSTNRHVSAVGNRRWSSTCLLLLLAPGSPITARALLSFFVESCPPRFTASSTAAFLFDVLHGKERLFKKRLWATSIYVYFVLNLQSICRL